MTMSSTMMAATMMMTLEDNDDNNNDNKDFKPFAPYDVIEAIKRSKGSTAMGPDNMSMLHLKHMGPLAISFLTTLFNLSVSRADLPSIWKFSLVIPVLKPAKDPSLGPSYRPISLLCPASKVL